MEIDPQLVSRILIAISEGARGSILIDGIDQQLLLRHLDHLRGRGLLDATPKTDEESRLVDLDVHGLSEWGGFFVEGLRHSYSTGRPSTWGNSWGIPPATGEGRAGNITAARTQVIQPPLVESDDVFPAPSVEAARPHALESRFELVTTRVRAAELALMSVRERPPGIGHNQGPTELEPLSAADLAEIDQFIALLKEQTPVTVIKPRELIEAETKTSRLRQKAGEYLDDFFKGFAKSAGEEAGKQAIRWIALVGALTALSHAVRSWLEAFPL